MMSGSRRICKYSPSVNGKQQAYVLSLDYKKVVSAIPKGSLGKGPGLTRSNLRQLNENLLLDRYCFQFINSLVQLNFCPCTLRWGLHPRISNVRRRLPHSLYSTQCGARLSNEANKYTLSRQQRYGLLNWQTHVVCRPRVWSIASAYRPTESVTWSLPSFSLTIKAHGSTSGRVTKPLDSPVTSCTASWRQSWRNIGLGAKKEKRGEASRGWVRSA